MPSDKAKNWANRPPKERVQLYLQMRRHFQEVASLTEDHQEAMSLRATARSCGGVAAMIQSRLDLAERADCCLPARLFGDCQCH